MSEPVSVANGEYLETWRDFLVPGSFAFDGARYMGLKLGLPEGYASPLGPCQISMFDEIISNPEPGQLLFYSDEGKRIGFERPFNFLPSTNASHPHLQLKAPWLKQLTLKDGVITKSFKQYPDKIYRLEKVEDLNGLTLTLTRDAEGRLERAEGPDGLALAFENDPAGRRTRITLIGQDGATLELARYGYDSGGRMVSADCAFGMSVRYSWLAGRDLLASWHNLTRASVTHFTYDEAGRVLHTATNGIWNDDCFRYAEGETTYLPGGAEKAAQRFLYDANENVTAEIDALGGEVAHRYDGAGFKVATIDANGYEQRTKYDQQGHVFESTDAEGRTTTYIWGDDGELHLTIDGAGNRHHYEHDTRSNVIAETDAEGHVTRLDRDERGRVLATHFPNGSVERKEWDEHNRLVSVTDAKGHVTGFAYDSFNRLIATTDPLGQVTRQDYRAGAGGFAIPTTITRPDGVSATRAFDAQGQLGSVRDGEGRTWSYRNSAFGVLEAITDPKGGLISFSHDIEGRVIGVTNANGLTYSYHRDVAGRVIEEEDFDGRVTRYARDPAGRVTETRKPDGARLTYAYDKTDLLTRIESFGPDGKPEDVIRFWYDGRALLIEAENRAASVRFERDRNGRIVSETLNGQTIASTRDAMGQRVLRELVGFSGGISRYVRDPLGAIEKLAIGEDARGNVFAFERDALGREAQRSFAGFVLGQRYDTAGQLVAQSAGARKPASLGRSSLGWNVPSGEGVTRRDGIQRRYEYNRAFAPTRIDDGLWGEQRFDYDDNGQLVTAEGARGAERFSYDPARNLAGASSAAPFSTESAGYGPAFDAAFGTVTPAAKPALWRRSAGGVVQIARGPKGERIELQHDECGRLIDRKVTRDGFRPKRWRYRWDAHNRLTEAERMDGETWLFRYDPFGRRVSKVRRFGERERAEAAQRWPRLVDGEGAPTPERPTDKPGLNPLPEVGTAYLWDGAQMVAEAPMRLDGFVAWDEALRWHFEGGESNDDAASHRLLAKELPGGTQMPDGSVLEKLTPFLIVTDHLGTPKEMFDRRGELAWAADHHVWGEVRTVATYGKLAAKPQLRRQPDALTCPWRFPGQYEDAETGLFYNRHRHYDPLTGQYASPDPIGLKGGDRPQGYVGVPSVWTDPLGLASRYSGSLVKVPQRDANADKLAAKLGGESRVKFSSDPDHREFDVVSNLYVAQTKPAMKQLSKKNREQFKQTFEAAKETGRTPYFHFDGAPHPDVLRKLNDYATRYQTTPKIDTTPW